MEQLFCPNCGAETTSDDFVCPSCQVILNKAAFEDEPISIVQALLSPANAPADPSERPRPRANVGDTATVRGAVLMDEFTVPRLVAGVDLALKPLHPFEAYVASFVDGAHSVPEIAAQADLSKIEAMAVLHSLTVRRIVELHRDERRPPRPEPSPAEAPVPGEEGEPKTDPAARPVSEALFAPESTAPGLAPDDPPLDGPDQTAPGVDAEEPESTSPGLATDVWREPEREDDVPFADASDVADLGEVPAEPAAAHEEVLEAPYDLAIRAGSGSQPQAAPASAAKGRRGASGSAPSRQLPAAVQRRERLRPLEERPDPLSSSAPKVENVLERAIALERRGDVDGAIQVLKRAIAQAKRPAPVYNKLALALIKRKEYQEAVLVLEKAVDLEPENPVYQQNLLKVMAASAARDKAPKKKQKGLLSKVLGRK